MEKKVHFRQPVRDVEERFLSLTYGKALAILRIIDSSHEEFNLRKQFKNRFRIITLNTKPEVEILLIHHKGDYEDYKKHEHLEKPSSYCKRRYGYKKNRGRFSDFFSAEELVDSIRRYDSTTERQTVAAILK